MLADGSAMRVAQDAAMNVSADEFTQDDGPIIRAVERLTLRDGWLVARDCGGLIVRRHVQPDVANDALDRTNTITLN
jgi:hypothetical protein